MLRRLENTKGRRLLFFLLPDFIAESVSDIDFAYLARQGVKAALIDLDGTVVARGTHEVSPEVNERLHTQPLKIYIATNRPRSRSLKNLKEQLGAQGVLHPIGIWGKPFPRYYAQAASEHGLNPKEAVMIGDRYLQDVFGANAAGLRTILVRKLDKPTNILDRLLSYVELRSTRYLSARYKPLKAKSK